MGEPGDQAPCAPRSSPRQTQSPPFWREGRAALRLVFQSRLVLLVVCVLTFVASLQFLLGGLGLARLDFLSAHQTKLWHMFLVFQPTLWVASLLSVFGDSRHSGSIWPGTRRERLALAFCALITSAIALLPAITQYLVGHRLLPANVDALTEMPHMQEKMLVFNCIGAVVGLMLATGMLSVHVQLVGHPPRSPSPTQETATGSLEAEVLRYQRLRAQLQGCLRFAGACISAMLLSVGAFRNLLIQAVPTQPGLLSITGALGFGVYFTGFLAIIYLPAAKTLSDAGEALAEQLTGRPPGAGAAWKQWSDEQKAVRTWLGLEGSSLQEFQQGFALLSPLIASLSALLLGAGK